MIRQPEFVDEEVVRWAISELMRKKPESAVDKVRFEAASSMLGLICPIMAVLERMV